MIPHQHSQIPPQLYKAYTSGGEVRFYSAYHITWRGLLVPKFASSYVPRPPIHSAASGGCSFPERLRPDILALAQAIRVFCLLLPSFALNPFLPLWRSSCWISVASRVSVTSLSASCCSPEPSSWKSCDKALLMCAEKGGWGDWGVCEDRGSVPPCECLVKGRSQSRRALVFSDGNEACTGKRNECFQGWKSPLWPLVSPIAHCFHFLGSFLSTSSDEDLTTRGLGMNKGRHLRLWHSCCYWIIALPHALRQVTSTSWTIASSSIKWE